MDTVSELPTDTSSVTYSTTTNFSSEELPYSRINDTSMDTPLYDDRSSLAGAESDDDFDWEEVEVPQQAEQPLDLSLEKFDVEEGPSHPNRPTIEITLSTKPKKDEEAKSVGSESALGVTVSS